MNLREGLKDTFLRGVVIGLASGVIKNALDMITLALHLKKFPFLYYSGVMAFNRPPKSGLDMALAQALELIFCAFLGFVYLFFLRMVKTRYKVIFGIFYGSMVWFTIKEVINAFKIKHLYAPLPFPQPALIWGLSLIYGLLLGLFDHYLEKKAGMIEETGSN